MKPHAAWAWVVVLCLTVLGDQRLRAEKVDDAWLKKVATLPAKEQVEAVAKKLKELNPDFDGKVTHKIEDGVVTEFGFITDNVKDISPVKALTGLKALDCKGSDHHKGKLADLSPLKDMRLTTLNCRFTQVSDLSPLKGLRLCLTCHRSRA
jgi:hypothetical protein